MALSFFLQMENPGQKSGAELPDGWLVRTACKLNHQRARAVVNGDVVIGEIRCNEGENIINVAAESAFNILRVAVRQIFVRSFAP